jgi:hypothetical protein
MEKYFYLDESPIYKNKYIIRLNHDKFLFPTGTSGSYNVFIARVLNLSYADYLRYSRDRLGAELVGKQSRYVVAYYDKNQATEAFVKLLNKRMEYIMHEHSFPYEYKEENGEVKRIPFEQNNEDNS